jgi:hypothetical protein
LYNISMTVNMGQLYKKRVIYNMNGGIRELTDETNGGRIISNGHVVNQERYDELLKIEEDKRIAAQAIAHQVSAPTHVAEGRTATPSKMQELEKRIDSQDAKLDAILAALKK